MDNPFLTLEASSISAQLAELESGLDPAFKDMLDKGLLEDGAEIAQIKMAATADAIESVARAASQRAQLFRAGLVYLLLGEALRRKLEP